jgi:hypothetical protein
MPFFASLSMLQRGEFLQDQAVGRIVCRRLVGVVVAHNAMLINDENSGHLEAASDGFTDPTFEKADKCFAQNAGTGEQADIAIGQAVGRVGVLLRVAQAGKWQTVCLPEGGGLLRVAHCHHDNFRTEGLKLLVVLSQLRYMLTAEWSAEVAQEDEDDGRTLPVIGEGDILSLFIA